MWCAYPRKNIPKLFYLQSLNWESQSCAYPRIFSCAYPRKNIPKLFYLQSLNWESQSCAYPRKNIPKLFYLQSLNWESQSQCSPSIFKKEKKKRIHYLSLYPLILLVFCRTLTPFSLCCLSILASLVWDFTVAPFLHLLLHFFLLFYILHLQGFSIVSQQPPLFHSSPTTWISLPHFFNF